MTFTAGVAVGMGTWVRGSLQTKKSSGLGWKLGRPALLSLCLQEELSCPPLSTPKLTSVGRRHRGQTGDRALGCSWLRGWSVTGLEGPQKPVSPPFSATTHQGPERAVPLPMVTQQVSGRSGNSTKGSYLSARALSWIPEALEEDQALRSWGRGRLGRWQWRLRLGRVSRAPGREEIPGREEFLPRGSTCHLYFSHQVAPDPHLCYSLAQAGEGAEDRGSLPLANTF